MRSSSVTHCLQSSLRKRYAWKLKNSYTKENAQDHVLFSEQIRNVVCKINTDKKQDHLGKHKAMHNRATGKPDGTSWISVSDISLSTVQQQDERRRPTFAKLIEKFEPESDKSDAEDQEVQWSIAKIAARYGPDREFRTLWEFCKHQCPDSDSFTEIGIIYWSASGVPQHLNRTTTISIRSLTTWRRIPVEDQSMANLRDKLCFSRHKTCWAKQRMRRTGIIHMTKTTNPFSWRIICIRTNVPV